ncbi:AMP dependent CoA ligase [Aspergillus terreus]|uniref:AMP dependent CoA ligase n=1 Tax=Aspergillus terreus TaxID=33178 RepID=A0A5M3Z4P0_ASPTE|nr:hypothetical protein ATETN484_0009037600 [Aspergillus terreus]GFF17827.1 AMP dependent CoA ligase [Aspergillus terreus]
MAHIYKSEFSPLWEVESLSIPQFMTRYNPYGVPADKVVHCDTFSADAITHGSLREQAGRAAWGLRHRLSVKPGDTVLALVPNSNEFILLAHATWWAGAVFAPLNTASTEKDVAHVLNLVRPTHVAMTESKMETVQRAAASVASVDPKIFTVLSKTGDIPRFPNDVVGKDDAESLPPYDLHGKSAKEVPSTICFSSGTTGNMKGVLLSHFNLIMNTLQMRNSMPLRFHSGIREVWFSPYCHIYGLAMVVICGMWVGGLYYGLPAFELELFCRKAAELKATDMHLVPPVALALANERSVQSYDLSSVERVVIAAAPLKVSLQRKLKERLPQASICQGNGLSECSPGVTHQLYDEESSCGSVGKLFAGTEVRLVDPNTGKDVNPGEEGELWVRGPQVMMGYCNDPVSTKASFLDDWLKTGDVMRVDADGNFWVTDRLKEMIKYKGFQIAPSELEDMLLRHDDVTDAAVCAVYDDAQATEVPLAYVSLTPEKANLSESEIQKTLDSIRQWMDSRVAGYKKLRGGVFHLQALPKSPTGKILRRLLPAKVQEQRRNRL